MSNWRVIWVNVSFRCLPFWIFENYFLSFVWVAFVAILLIICYFICVWLNFMFAFYSVQFIDKSSLMITNAYLYITILPFQVHELKAIKLQQKLSKLESTVKNNAEIRTSQQSAPLNERYPYVCFSTLYSMSIR